MNYWLHANSGSVIDYEHPRSYCMSFQDVVNALSHICRFVGQTHKFYSVAEHSVNLVGQAYESVFSEDYSFLLCVLLHDASEAYTGDLPSPLKSLVPQLREVEKALQSVILEHLCLPVDNPEYTCELANLESRLLATEADQLLHPCWEGDWYTLDQLIPGFIIEGWSPDKARQEFTKMFKSLFVGHMRSIGELDYARHPWYMQAQESE